MKKILCFSFALFYLFSAQGQELFWFMRNGKCGYVNRSGKVIIPPKYILSGQFNEGLAVAAIGDNMFTAKYGYINPKGEWVIQPQFEAADIFSEGKARVQLRSKWGYINKTGKWLIEPKYALCYEFRKGMAAASVETGKWGLIDSTGHFWVPAIYYDIARGDHNIFPAQLTRSSQWMIKDINGQTLNEKGFSRMGAFSGEIAPARNDNDKWGFVDIHGAWLINPVFTGASPFSEDLAAVANEAGDWGFIDRKGEWVIKPLFIASASFHNGYAMVEKVDSIVYIDKKGQPFFSFKR